MIFLIRHGQTEFNAARRLQGRMDSPLTGLGVEQARRMGRRLLGFVDEPSSWSVVASPLGRARRTAEIVCEELGLGCAVELDERLAEVDVGAWEGLGLEEIEAVSPGVHGTPGWLLKAPRGETWETASARVAGWLAEHDEADGRRRVVVSHGITGRVLRALYEGSGPEAMWTAAPPPQDAVFRLYGGRVERLDVGAQA